MTLAPIEDVIRAAERQAEIDWELEHRAPKAMRARQRGNHLQLADGREASAQTVGSRCRDAYRSGDA